MSTDKTFKDFRRESLKNQIKINENSLNLHRTLLKHSRRNFCLFFTCFLIFAFFGIFSIKGVILSAPFAVVSILSYRDIKSHKYSVSLYERANETFVAKCCTAFEAARYRKYGADGI